MTGLDVTSVTVRYYRGMPTCLTDHHVRFGRIGQNSFMMTQYDPDPPASLLACYV